MDGKSGFPDEKLMHVLFHELKAPLSAVASYLFLLKEGTLGDSLAAYQDMICKAGVRLDQMQELLGDLRDVSMVDSGKRERRIEQVLIPALVEDVCEKLKPAASSRNITFDIIVPAGILFTGDAWEISRIVHHLLSNAIKFNVEGGRAELRIETEDPSSLTITVIDSGIGIADADTGKIFEDFVRIKNSATKGIWGTGLGLSLVRRLEALYNGKVIVESEIGKGSTFIVRILTAA